jgi:hypothetical protein
MGPGSGGSIVGCPGRSLKASTDFCLPHFERKQQSGNAGSMSVVGSQTGKKSTDWAVGAVKSTYSLR